MSRNVHILLHTVHQGFLGGIATLGEESKRAWCLGRGLPSDLVRGSHVSFTPSAEHEVLRTTVCYETSAGVVVGPLNMIRVGVQLQRIARNLPWEQVNDVSLYLSPPHPLNHTHL